MPRVLCAALLAAASLLASVQIGHAQQWPNRPVRIVVGFTPGSTLDLMARALANPLTEQLGQQFIVENKPGGSGKIGIDIVASAKPDGYTFGVNATGPLAALPHLQGTPLPPLSAVSLMAVGPMIVAVSKDSSIKTLADLVDTARKEPGKLTYGSTGIGTTPHLAAELLSITANIKLRHVPYKGNTDGLNDVATNEITMMFSGLPPVLPFTADGRLRVLAATGKTRNAQLPDVPSIAEAGFPDAEAVSYYGLFGPAGVPNDIRTKLSTEIAKAIKRPEVQKLFQNLGVDAQATTPEDYSRIMAEDSDKWRAVIEKTGMKLN